MQKFQTDPLQSESDVQSQIDAAPEAEPAPLRLVVIPCTGSKRQEISPARSLYTGATFPAALHAGYVLADPAGEVMILSALHGLLALTDEIAPYDVKMGDELAIDSEGDGIVKLAEQIAEEIDFLSTESATGSVEILLLLPNAYRKAFETALLVANALRDLPPFTVRNLYEGARGIGDQKSVCRRISSGELRV